MLSVKMSKPFFFCMIECFKLYFSLGKRETFSLLKDWNPCECFFLPVSLFLLSFIIYSFTILYCSGTVFEITAGNSEKHFDKGRLNCDLRPRVSYRNK